MQDQIKSQYQRRGMKAKASGTLKRRGHHMSTLSPHNPPIASSVGGNFSGRPLLSPHQMPTLGFYSLMPRARNTTAWVVIYR